MCGKAVILPLEWGQLFKRLNPLARTLLTRTQWNETFYNWPLECKCWFLFSFMFLNLSARMNWAILNENLISVKWLNWRVTQRAGRVWTELLVLCSLCYNSSSDRNSPLLAPETNQCFTSFMRSKGSFFHTSNTWRTFYVIFMLQEKILLLFVWLRNTS